MKRAVFLDRDGVINAAILSSGTPRPPRKLSEFQILDGVVEAVETLKSYSYELVVVTNQPDITRGFCNLKDIQAFHNIIRLKTGIEHFYICPHDDIHNCSCRKPKPGLILEASKDLGINLSCSYLIGDRWRDIEAAQAAGCKAFFIDYSYDERQPNSPFVKVDSLRHASYLINESEEECLSKS